MLNSLLTMLLAGQAQSGIDNYSQAISGQPGQPTNLGAITGGAGGMLLGGIGGALAGRKASNWALGQQMGRQRGLAAWQRNPKSVPAATAAKFENMSAAETKGLGGLLTKARGSAGGVMESLAANPRLAMAGGAVLGASLLGGMMARKAGAPADAQYASKIQQIQAQDAAEQQEALNTIANAPQIRF